MKVNLKKLPVSFENFEEYGLFYELYPSGHLHKFGIEGGRVLILEETKKEARYEYHGGYDLYTNGAVDTYDAWSDNQRPERVWYSFWVKKIVHEICNATIRSTKMSENAAKNREEIRKVGGLKRFLKIVKRDISRHWKSFRMACCRSFRLEELNINQ